MVDKQSAQTSFAHKKTIPSNQKWMEEFEKYQSSDDFDDKASAQFSEIFEESQKQSEMKEGEVLNGRVIAIGEENVTVDIGYKTEGLIPVYEFKDAQGNVNVQINDPLSVFIEKIEINEGYVLLSKDKADILRAWDDISSAVDSDQIVEGTVLCKVKGGFTVDIGVKAFLPVSQLEIRSEKQADALVGQKLKFKIIKFNKKRGNIVLSHKAVIQQEKEVQRIETLKNLEEGMVLSGIVKNITEYGAFIDLGGMDGLLHITDMSWGRIKHPSELFKVGDEIKVKVLKYDREKERVSLGFKQASPNPWDEAELRYPVGKIVKGKVVSLKDYGAFIELEDGVEGLIHVSEMSWTERIKHPSKVLKADDEVECKVLEVDTSNKRISLGIKQLLQNPWDELETKFPVGSIVEEGTVKSITDFGLFVDVGLGIDGLVHVSDLSWTKKVTHPSEKFKKGDKIKTVVLGIDRDNEKFSLGVKQLERDPWDNIKSRYRVGQSIDGKVTKLTDFGAFIEIEEGVEGLIYVSEISEKRVEKPSDILQIGQDVKAEILSIEPKERRIALSMKQLTRSEDRAAYESYMTNTSSGKTSMGDVLGDKLKSIFNKNEESGDSSEDEK